jgi:ceramide glucosyltransferase
LRFRLDGAAYTGKLRGLSIDPSDAVKSQTPEKGFNRLLRSGSRPPSVNHITHPGSQLQISVKYSVLRPLHENEPFLERTLESSFHLRGDYEVIFCAESLRLDAVTLATRLCREHPEIPSRIVAGPQNDMSNPMLNNLYKAWSVARGEWVLMVNSNVLLTPDAFERVEKAWRIAGTGIVSGPAVGACPGNFWAEVECAFLNTYQAKWAMLSERIGYGFCQGKVIFTDKARLEGWGGLAVLDVEPAEDSAATKLVRRHGLKVRYPRPLFEQALGARSFSAVWHRQLRWARLRRATFPIPYALEFVTTLIPVMIVAWFYPFATMSLTALCYLGELYLARAMGWHSSVWSLPAMIVRDLLLLGIWVGGWFSNRFQWGGHDLSLSRRR